MKIWLVEDNDVYRVMLGKLLRKFTPYSIERDFTDQESIENLLQEFSSEEVKLPDLLLLDLYLPGYTGWEILDRMKENKLKIPVIIISQSSSDSDISKSKLYPEILGYFHKNDFPTTLFSMISELDSNRQL
jgi:CheY-like chemotaxis protein